MKIINKEGAALSKGRKILVVVARALSGAKRNKEENNLFTHAQKILKSLLGKFSKLEMYKLIAKDQGN